MTQAITAVDRVRSMYLTACMYSGCAWQLNTESSKQSKDQPPGVPFREIFFLPSKVLAALSLEVLFKSLYYLEFGEDFKIKNQHSHNFHHLYRRLRSKEALDSAFDATIRTRSMQDVETLRGFGMIVSLDLDTNLRDWSHVFVKMRYVYDKPDESISMMFYPEIWAVARDAVCAVRSDLR